MPGKTWSPEEDDTLRDLWPDVEAIGTRLRHRTTNGIERRGQRLGLLAPDHARLVADKAGGVDVSKLRGVVESVVGHVRRKIGPPPTSEIEPGGVQEHEANLMLSDAHVGAVVRQSIGDYNTDVFLERFNRLEQGVASFTSLYRPALPLKVINVFELGDDLEGHGQIYPAQALFMDRNLREQWLTFAERTTVFLERLLEMYEQVNVWKVVGNHGRVGRRNEHHPEDNVEAFLWHFIRERFRDQDRLRITIAEDFFMLVERMGRLFLLLHGENTSPHSPYAARGAFNVKLRMNSLVGRVIDYMLVAHHHTPIILDRELVGEIVYNGCFVGPNDLSVKVLHEGNVPSQWFFLTHPTYGAIHWSKIKLSSPKELRKRLVIHE